MSDLPGWARFITDRRAHYALAWLLALTLAVARIINGQWCFHRPERVDGNQGHTSIDFGGQWLMGRLLATGHGSDLFSRSRQLEVARQAYPPDREIPGTNDHDPEGLLQHFMTTDDPEVGGPLYPPIHAFVMLPFALGDHPQAAYFAMQYAQTALCFVAGLGVSWLSGGRFWWPLASALLLVYPGCRGVVDLGQNSALSLALLIWGWVVMARGRPALGGCLWGILAYKPVWAISFFLLLVLIRQWRAALAMGLTGSALAAATLPFVGLHSWRHWLAVGQEAALIYNVDSNWIPFSRDLLGIPRRFLLDFSLPRNEREQLFVLVACWALWAVAVEIALRVHALCGGRSVPFSGPLPAFLILTAWMCTYHFMYYDALLSAFGVCVLLADPRPFFMRRPLRAPPEPGRRSVWLVNSFVLTLVVLLVLEENTTRQMGLEVTAVAHSFTAARTNPDGTTKPGPRILVIGGGDRYPVDTLLVIAIWGWCAVAALAGSFSERANGSRDGIAVTT